MTNDSSSTMLKIADAAALASVAFLMISGFILHGAMPASARLMGVTPPAGMPNFLGFTNGEWLKGHYVATFFLMLSVLPNLFVAWPGRAGAERVSRIRFGSGILGGIAMLAFAAFWMGAGEPNWGRMSPLPGNAPMQSMDPSFGLTSLSLQDIEQKLGVPAAHLRKALRLPEDVSTTTPVRDLMLRHNFSTDQLREAMVTQPLPERRSQP